MLDGAYWVQCVSSCLLRSSKSSSSATATPASGSRMSGLESSRANKGSQHCTRVPSSFRLSGAEAGAGTRRDSGMRRVSCPSQFTFVDHEAMSADTFGEAFLLHFSAGCPRLAVGCLLLLCSTKCSKLLRTANIPGICA